MRANNKRGRRAFNAGYL
jgi:hypothetical protein